jgi:hypothetical protein
MMPNTLLFAALSLMLVGEIFAAKPMPSPTPPFEEVTIKPITQRPCLLMDASEIPELKRRIETMPDQEGVKGGKMEPTLHALLYGNDEEKKAETAEFIKTFRSVFSGPGKDDLWKERRVNELLYKYDIIASFGFLTNEEQQEFQKDAVEFARYEIGDDPSKFPSAMTPSTNGLEFPTGFAAHNRWTERFVTPALVALNFPDIPQAKSWVQYSIQQTRYELPVGNWDGAWNEVPRYHDAMMRIFSPYFQAMKNRTSVDFYQDPNVKALLDWYVRFSSPLIRYPKLTKQTPQGKSTLPVFGASSYEENFFNTLALYAPQYRVTDPEFSKRLMWMWRRGGSGPVGGSHFALTYPQMADPSLPDAPQTLESEFCKKFGYVLLRSDFNTPEETVVYMRGGLHGVSHSRADLGSFDLFSLGLPLVINTGAGEYSERGIWSGMQDANNDVVFGGKPVRIGNGTPLAFFTSPQVDYAVADCSYEGKSIPSADSFKWKRHLLLVKNPNYLVVWDQISSPMSSEWYLHTTADHFTWKPNLVTATTAYNADLDVHVLSPAGSLTPNEAQSPFQSWNWDKPPKESPFMFPYLMLRFFSIKAQPSEDYITVLHPRRPDGAPITTQLVSQTKEKIVLKITHGTSTDLITLGNNGAIFQRDTAPSITIPMAIKMPDVPHAR